MSQVKKLADAINDFVVGCKADGIWDSIKACCILAGWDGLSGCLVPLKGAAPTNSNFVAGDYNRKTGLVGNGSNKTLNANRLGNADGQNDKHLCVYASTAVLGAGFVGFIGGVDGNSASGRFDLYQYLNNFDGHLHANSSISVAGSTSPGFIGLSRVSASEFTLRALGATTTKAATSSSPSAVNTMVFARGRETGTPDLYAAHRIAFYSIGSGLNLTTLDTRVSTLYTAIGAAIP